jgi:UDP-bacillosamine synthetase
MKPIPFSPPDITDLEIQEVVDTLKSGWITTGPKTKMFENKIAEYCKTPKSVCLNSNTAGLELILRILEIGEGDEVIVPAYTYTASASVVNHVGAKIVFVDCKKDSFEMDYDLIEEKITENTKAIIAVDIAGIIANYDKIFEIVKKNKEKFKPSNEIQKKLGRIAVIADAAHSFGAKDKNRMSGSIADFTSFSFHAVKNLTTAEGGATTWKSIDGIDNEWLYKQFMLWSLHGQNKDALNKNKAGQWEYDIKIPGYKCNMTDIMASIGLAQLKRYDALLARRREIISKYNQGFKNMNVQLLDHYNTERQSSGHLYLVRLIGKNEEQRNELINRLAEQGITTNVHYKPLPMMTAYKNLGYDIKDYPNAYKMYENEITLPLHTLLTDGEVEYIIEKVNEEIE